MNSTHLVWSFSQVSNLESNTSGWSLETAQNHILELMKDWSILKIYNPNDQYPDGTPKCARDKTLSVAEATIIVHRYPEYFRIDQSNEEVPDRLSFHPYNPEKPYSCGNFTDKHLRDSLALHWESANYRGFSRPEKWHILPSEDPFIKAVLNLKVPEEMTPIEAIQGLALSDYRFQISHKLRIRIREIPFDQKTIEELVWTYPEYLQIKEDSWDFQLRIDLTNYIPSIESTWIDDLAKELYYSPDQLRRIELAIQKSEEIRNARMKAIEQQIKDSVNNQFQSLTPSKELQDILWEKIWQALDEEIWKRLSQNPEYCKLSSLGKTEYLFRELDQETREYIKKIDQMISVLPNSLKWEASKLNRYYPFHIDNKYYQIHFSRFRENNPYSFWGSKNPKPFDDIEVFSQQIELLKQTWKVDWDFFKRFQQIDMRTYKEIL